jgi:hypothetical protein
MSMFSLDFASIAANVAKAKADIAAAKTLEDLNKARAARDAAVASKPPKVTPILPPKTSVANTEAAALAKAKAKAEIEPTSSFLVPDADLFGTNDFKSVFEVPAAKDDTMYAGGSSTFDETAGIGRGLTDDVSVPEPALQAGGGGINYDSSTAVTIPSTVAPVASTVPATETITKDFVGGDAFKDALNKAIEYGNNLQFEDTPENEALIAEISGRGFLQGYDKHQQSQFGFDVGQDFAKYLADNNIPLSVQDKHGNWWGLNTGPARFGTLIKDPSDVLKNDPAVLGTNRAAAQGDIGTYSVPITATLKEGMIPQWVVTAGGLVNPLIGAVMAGLNVKDAGGDWGDALKSGALSFAGNQVGAEVGGAAGAATSAYGPVVSGAAAGAAGSAVNTAVQGGDLSEIAQAGLFGGLGGAGSAYVNDFVTGVQADNLGLDTQAGIDSAVASGDIGQIGTSYGNYNEVPDNVDQRIWDEEFSLGTPDSQDTGVTVVSQTEGPPDWIEGLIEGLDYRRSGGFGGTDVYIDLRVPVEEETKDSGGEAEATVVL